MNDVLAMSDFVTVRCHRAEGHDGGHKPYPLAYQDPEQARSDDVDGDKTCQNCSRENPVWWVDDDLWNFAFGTTDNPRGEGIVVCPSCFGRALLGTLQWRIAAIANLPPVVFASDDKEREMLSRGVVLRVLRGA